MTELRKSNYPIEKSILERRSLRAMTGEEITEDELFTLFEAARWAPSAYNSQPWRFIYGKRGTPAFDKLFSVLIEFNQSWTINAAVLVCVVSKKTSDNSGKPMKTHSFDTGLAVENLALQGTINGLVIHPMEGFDYEKARSELKISDDFQVEAMIAIGKPAPKETLPKELEEREVPSLRKELSELVFEGSM